MAAPQGTRAWRKSWRKRWREDSTYRSLTLLQRELLRWIEENADDEGRAGPTTVRWLSLLFSSPTERVSKSAVHRAAMALERAGLVRREAGQDPGRIPGHAPMTYVRENWGAYQGKQEEPGQAAGLGTNDTRDYLAEEGRGKQIAVLPAAAPTAAGKWPLGEKLRLLVGQGLAIIGPGGDGLRPPTAVEERDRLEVDLAKVGVDAAAASCIEQAKRNGKGSGISSLRYFLAHVHDIAEPAAALPAPRGRKPLATAPAEVHTHTGRVAL